MSRSPMCAAAVSALAVVLLTLQACQSRPMAPEPQLRGLWDAYQHAYVQASGEVRDPLRKNQVTSEAQSYALLQAALLGDRQTFDRVRAWTDTRLKRSDGLYSWLWDPATQRLADVNTATDADTDIALALVVASTRFAEPALADAARGLARSIRQHASVAIGAPPGWLPSAGNWAGPERIVNLSYFAPYAYRYFDRLDPEGGWPHAIDAGYALLRDALDASMLPADFVIVSPDGHVGPLPSGSRLSRAFSYDAIRILWRIDLDCRWHQEPKACALVTALVDRLERIRTRDGRFSTRYASDGTREADDESVSVYGAFLPAYARERPAVARQWRAGRLSDDAITRMSRSTRRYYDANWVWFGLASANGVLARRLPPLDAVR